MTENNFNDADKFYEYIEEFETIFEECKHCDRGKIALFIHKHDCEECNGSGYVLFPDIDLIKEYVQYYNGIYKSNRNTKDLQTILKWCDVPSVFSTSFLQLKYMDDFCDYSLSEKIEEAEVPLPKNNTEIISHLAVNTKDLTFNDTDIEKLLYCLNYHVNQS